MDTTEEGKIKASNCKFHVGIREKRTPGVYNPSVVAPPPAPKFPKVPENPNPLASHMAPMPPTNATGAASLQTVTVPEATLNFLRTLGVKDDILNQIPKKEDSKIPASPAISSVPLNPGTVSNTTINTTPANVPSVASAPASTTVTPNVAPGGTNNNPLVVDDGTNKRASAKKDNRMKKRVKKKKLNVAIHKVIADNLQDGLTSRAIHAALEDGIKTLRQYSTGDTSSEESDN